jgi:hypothetical protein
MSFKETVDRLRQTTAPMRSPDELVSAWQHDVARLYDEIAEWLKPYVDDGGISLSRQEKAASEERTGSYTIDQLDIDIGNETVRLDPRATSVIGARGRIDMSHLGSGDPVMLILLGDAEHPLWKIVDPAERTKQIPLDKGSFEATLDRLLEEYGTHAEPSI